MMNFLRPNSTNDEAKDANYYAFFDKPSPENLAANRSGVLTSEQQNALQRNVANQRVNNIIVIGTLILSALFMIFVFWKIDSLDGTLSVTANLINVGVLIVSLGIFAAWLTGSWFVYSMGDDLDNKGVESAIGRIEWTGRSYRMRADNRVLRSFGLRVLPPPGDYRFYYLPHTGLVVMAEKVATSDVPHESILLRALASANDFSLEELKLNQQGRLSKQQENRLVLIAVLSVAIGLSTAALFAVLIPRLLHELSTTGFVVPLIIGAILLLRFGWGAILILSDVWHGDVSSVEGRVSRHFKRSRYSHSYYYVSGLQKFQVSRAAYNALIESQPYRIFYVPRSKRLVSIEPI